jgi:hypothetical protein
MGRNNNSIDDGPSNSNQACALCTLNGRKGPHIYLHKSSGCPFDKRAKNDKVTAITIFTDTEEDDE